MSQESAEVVSFTRMKDGTAEDYHLLERHEAPYVAATADRVLAYLLRLHESLPGYRVTRLEHSLQSASRAEKDGADIDWIVTALLHDIGDELAPLNHSKLAAAVIEPFVREQCTWVLHHHGVFQMVYFAHHFGGERHARERFRDSPYYEDAVAFCERWDQESFDPAYPTPPLEHFAPLVHEVFSRPAFDPAVLRAGERVPLRG